MSLKTFSVKSVALELGVTPHTLRAWETRYRAVSPGRTQAGQRQYSAKELERLRLLVKLVNQGHRISSIAGLPDSKLKTLDTPSPLPPDPHKHPITHLISLLRDFRISEIARELENLRLRQGSGEFILETLAPLLGSLGKHVQEGKISIAQEHMLSAIIREQLSRTFNPSRPNDLKEPDSNFAFCTPEGDLHEFGILMGAALCDHHGLGSFYLGANMPAKPLAEAAKHLPFRTLVLGVTATSVDLQKSYLTLLHKHLPKNIELWIGGNASTPHLDGVLRGRSFRKLKSLLQLDLLLRERASR